MLIKIWAHGGVKAYSRDPFNVFDAILVIISIFDFSITAFFSDANINLSVVTAFRTLRILRLLKLASKSDNLQTLF